MNEQIILDRILNDANNQAKIIIDEANQEIENLKNSLTDYENELNQKTENELKKFKEKHSELFSNNLDFNKRIFVLEVKNQVINDLKEKAVKKINLLEKAEKLHFFEQILLQNAENNENLFYNISDFEDEDFSNMEVVKTLNLQIKKDLSIDEGIILSTDIYYKNL